MCDTTYATLKSGKTSIIGTHCSTICLETAEVHFLGPSCLYCKTINVRVPFIRGFRELNKTTKLTGVNIDTIPSLIGINRVLELCGLNSTK